MEKFLAEHKQIDAVLSANDSMALGVLEALKAANRTAIVIGINGILPAVKQIETGGMLATVDFNMFKIGCTATRAAVRYLKQEPLPEKVMLPAEVIDKTNYKAWLVPVTSAPARIGVKLFTERRPTSRILVSTYLIVRLAALRHKRSSEKLPL